MSIICRTEFHLFRFGIQKLITNEMLQKSGQLFKTKNVVSRLLFATTDGSRQKSDKAVTP